MGEERGKCCAFFPSPATFYILSSLSWGSFCGILVVFMKRRVPQMSTFGFSGCRVKPRRPQSRRVSHDPHTSGPGLQKHHQKSTRKTPEREEKNEFCGGRRKKSAKFRPPTLRGPTLRGPFFLGLGLNLRGATLRAPPMEVQKFNIQ